jgi:hypothetical protein
MTEQNANQDSTISDSLHPLVNMAIIGLVLMFVAAVWMFFDIGPYEAWLDVVVTGLFVIAIAVPALLWLTWRRNAEDVRDDSHRSFREWSGGRFQYLDRSRERGERGRRSPAADRCSRHRDDGAGIGVPHHREWRRLILYAEDSAGPLALAPDRTVGSPQG